MFDYISAYSGIMSIQHFAEGDSSIVASSN